MCGSGTFLIEAAMIAANIAPGILRESYGFLEWKQYESNIWDGLISDARSKRKVGLAELDIEIKGHDINPRIIEMAAKNIEKAGLDEYIKVSQRSIESIAAPRVQKGLFITNPAFSIFFAAISIILGFMSCPLISISNSAKPTFLFDLASEIRPSQIFDSYCFHSKNP
jgi:23S rRNA G2445 N2-methylase RlmL